MIYNINKQLLIEEKNKAFKNWKENFLYKKFSNILYHKIIELKQNFDNVLLITSDLTETIEEISKINSKNLFYVSPYDFFTNSYFRETNFNKIVANLERIPLKKGCFDLIICNFSINKVVNKKNYLLSLLELLNDEGLFFCNFFGEETLKQLKECFFLADEKFFSGSFTRIPKNIMMTEFTNFLSEIGFKEVVAEKINFEIFYKNILTLIRDIRDAGELENMTDSELRITKNYLKYLQKIYEKKFSNKDNFLQVNLDIISTSSWKKRKN